MTREALVLPGLEDERQPWTVRTKSDSAALALGDRHYNRHSVGSPWIGPPGRLLTLVTQDERALWLTHWPEPELAKDGLDAWRCSAFRNEGAGLSSYLIVAAMELTAELWLTRFGARPRAGWLTYVDRRKVRSTNPGYCYLAAGWRRDRDFVAQPWARGLVRLRHDALRPHRQEVS